MNDLEQFASVQRLVRFLDPLMEKVLANLDTRYHDLLVQNYGLPGYSSRAEGEEFATAAAERKALYKAQRALSVALEKELRTEIETASGDKDLFLDALSLVRGEKPITVLANAPSPATMERVSENEFQQRSIEIPVNRELISYFSSHPELLDLMDPREFEMLTADLLSTLGYSVSVAPLGRDGGVDVYAEQQTALGTELVLVQCKRFRIDRRVGEPVIKQLYADVVGRQATRGLVVTTSYFSRVALKYLDLHRYQLDGIDNPGLQSWLQKISPPVAAEHS